MTITSIRQSSPGDFTVCTEDGAEIRSTLSVVTDMRLFTGKELSGAELEQLSLESSRAFAKEKAIECISRRPMSCKELQRKLIDKGVDTEIADYCVAWLSERNMLDDENYAAIVARHYFSKGYGPSRIKSEFQRRGVDRELWDEALESLPTDTSKIDKFISSRLTDLTDRNQLRKISSALFRRGYSWEEINRAMARVNADCEDF